MNNSDKIIVNAAFVTIFILLIKLLLLKYNNKINNDNDNIAVISTYNSEIVKLLLKYKDIDINNIEVTKFLKYKDININLLNNIGNIKKLFNK